MTLDVSLCVSACACRLVHLCATKCARPAGVAGLAGGVTTEKSATAVCQSTESSTGAPPSPPSHACFSCVLLMRKLTLGKQLFEGVQWDK